MAIIKNYLEKLRKVDMEKSEKEYLCTDYMATCSQFVGETRHKTRRRSEKA